ncbi:MAG: sugar transporter substrate-binding protein [Clostridia bacterium]|nr:sugar transporter substrate-binding protein [Clostridia bacterium]
MNDSLNSFIEKLSSGEPTPGGGGASALIGAVGVALCSMVANLTSGKKKYAEYQKDIEIILAKTNISINNLLLLIDKDAEVFAPLAFAYGIPKDDPNRATILENALRTACSVPIEIINEITNILNVVEELIYKGSRLAISDVGVAASACRSAIEGASLNVYINTKLMTDKAYAYETNIKIKDISEAGIKRCEDIYEKVLKELRG